MSSTRLEVLECFAVVAELGSISAAARKVGASQPTISRRISALEQSLGSKLLIRTTDGVVLTDIGKHFLAQLSPALARVSALIDEMSDVDEQVTGEIKIAALSAYGEVVLMPKIISFRTLYPRVTFAIEFLKEIDIIHALREGETNLGVFTQIPDGHWLRAFRIGSERTVLVTAFDNLGAISTIKDLYSAEFVTYRSGDPLFEMYIKQNFPGAQRTKLKVAYSVNSHRSMIDILRSGPFYGVLPFSSIESEIVSHVLRLASDREMDGGLFIGHRSEERLARRFRLFIDHMKP